MERNSTRSVPLQILLKNSEPPASALAAGAASAGSVLPADAQLYYLKNHAIAFIELAWPRRIYLIALYGIERNGSRTATIL